jgi:hypothetical protein
VWTGLRATWIDRFLLVVCRALARLIGIAFPDLHACVFSDVGSGELLIETVEAPFRPWARVLGRRSGRRGRLWPVVAREADRESGPRCCQVLWGDEPLTSCPGRRSALWIDAPRAAALAYLADRWPARPEGRSFKVTVAVVTTLEVALFRVRILGDAPASARAQVLATRTVGIGGALHKVIASALGPDSRSRTTVLVATPERVNAGLAGFRRAASILGLPRLEPRDVLRGYAAAWARRLASDPEAWPPLDEPAWRVGFPRPLWGTVAQGSLEIPSTEPRVSWSLDLEGGGVDGGRLELSIAGRGGQGGERDAPLRIAAHMPIPPSGTASRFAARLDVCPSTGSARLIAPCTDDGRHPVVGGNGSRVVAWPVAKGNEPDGPHPPDRSIMVAALVVVGGNAPNPGFVRRSAALLQTLARAGRLRTLALERGGNRRRVSLWPEDRLTDLPRSSLAGWLARGSPTDAATECLEDTLRLTLGRSVPFDGGILLAILADRHAGLGPNSLLGRDMGCWAWWLVARREFRCDIRLTASAEPAADSTSPVARALEALVLLGSQATHDQSLVNWWLPGDDPEAAGREDAEALLDLLDRRESPTRHSGQLRVVAARRIPHDEPC